MDGHRRADIRPGMLVDIVLKRTSRPAGARAAGSGGCFTKSGTHPHGIKVMLEDGQVGRVQEIIGEESE